MATTPSVAKCIVADTASKATLEEDSNGLVQSYVASLNGKDQQSTWRHLTVQDDPAVLIRKVHLKIF